MGKSIFGSLNPAQGPVPAQPMSGVGQFANPIQKVNYILRTLTDPAAFVKQQFPDIPDEIANDPDKVLSYLQQSRGISNEMLRQLGGQRMGGM